MGTFHIMEQFKIVARPGDFWTSEGIILKFRKKIEKISKKRVEAFRSKMTESNEKSKDRNWYVKKEGIRRS